MHMTIQPQVIFYYLYPHTTITAVFVELLFQWGDIVFAFITNCHTNFHKFNDLNIPASALVRYPPLGTAKQIALGALRLKYLITDLWRACLGLFITYPYMPLLYSHRRGYRAIRKAFSLDAI